MKLIQQKYGALAVYLKEHSREAMNDCQPKKNRKYSESAHRTCALTHFKGNQKKKKRFILTLLTSN